MFSKKTKTPPVYKALTSEFRDTLRFGFVSSDRTDIIEEYFIEDYPKILVVKSYDPETKTVLDNPEIVTYEQAEFKFEEMRQFLNEFARSEKKSAPEDPKKKDSKKKESSSDDDSSSNRRQKKPYSEIYDHRQFTSKILDSEKAALTFFVLNNNSTSDVPLFDKILKEVKGSLNVGVYYINSSSPDYEEQNKKYKLGKKFPQLRFYKNNILGEDKNKHSFEIYLKKFAEVMDEIHDGVESEVKEVTEKILNSIIIGHAVEDKKNCIIYFYNDDRISLHIKALSSLPIMKEYFVFIAVFGPAEDTLQGF